MQKFVATVCAASALSLTAGAQAATDPLAGQVTTSQTGWHSRVVFGSVNYRKSSGASGTLATIYEQLGTDRKPRRLGKLTAPTGLAGYIRDIGAGRDGYAVMSELQSDCQVEEDPCESGWRLESGSWGQAPRVRMSCTVGTAPTNTSVVVGDGFIAAAVKGCDEDGIYVLPSGEGAPVALAGAGQVLSAAGDYLVYVVENAPSEKRQVRLRNVKSGQETSIDLGTDWDDLLGESWAGLNSVLAAENGTVLFVDGRRLATATMEAPELKRVATVANSASDFVTDGAITWHREESTLVRTDLTTGHRARFGQPGVRMFPLSVGTDGTPATFAEGCRTFDHHRWRISIASPRPLRSAKLAGCPVFLASRVVPVTPVAHPTELRSAVMTFRLRCPSGCDVQLQFLAGGLETDTADITLPPTGKRFVTVNRDLGSCDLRYMRSHHRVRAPTNVLFMEYRKTTLIFQLSTSRKPDRVVPCQA